MKIVRKTASKCQSCIWWPPAEFEFSSPFAGKSARNSNFYFFLVFSLMFFKDFKMFLLVSSEVYEKT
ncbi:hypothetical protein B9Z55_015860 [Caenorhabditis nigoni]|uniref:Uncharacterized protein n=1 Tax=Caenorhabditis nigoni TaxID=1611254 RepID=A0A2G5UC69_9PELO|nr:hypothetical protein B9Z55_015860 [Caenorhabditis nigoni]